MTENGIAAVGRYQIVAFGKGEAVLLDTATGSTWSLARDIDTLQLGWHPLQERWPDSALDRPQGPGGEADGSAMWWKPRAGSRWSRAEQSGG